jgi:hypothetical protein
MLIQIRSAEIATLDTPSFQKRIFAPYMAQELLAEEKQIMSDFRKWLEIQTLSCKDVIGQML